MPDVPDRVAEIKEDQIGFAYKNRRAKEGLRPDEHMMTLRDGVINNRVSSAAASSPVEMEKASSIIKARKKSHQQHRSSLQDTNDDP